MKDGKDLPMRIVSPEEARKQPLHDVQDWPFPEPVLGEAFQLMKEHKGVGLAAPQVGRLEKWFIVELAGKRYVFCNPKVVSKSKTAYLAIEGCLSLGQERLFYVPRASTVEVNFTDENGRYMEWICTGQLAQVIQHEYDHLKGVLINDYPQLPGNR